ncbi:MAG: PIG-L family deacetylase [Nitrospinota bacterium]
MSTILFVGTHPDDIDFGVGATAKLLASRGDDVYFLDLTNGEPTPFGTPEIRAIESANAAKILSVKKRITLDIKNREVVDSVENRHKVAEVYRAIRPDLILAQHEKDYHPDHMASSMISWKARFDAKLTKTDLAGEPFFAPYFLRFLASHMPQMFQPSFVIDVTETFDAKIEAVKSYESQLKMAKREKWLVDKLTDMAKFYGGLVNVKYGEPFYSEDILSLASFDPILQHIR